MKNRFLFFGLLFSISIRILAQTEDAWVFFHDKPGYATYLNNPLLMLSQRALDRRARYGIGLDISDVPVDENYVAQIKSVQGLEILGKSKWLNCLHVRGDSSTVASLLEFSFVDSIRFARTDWGSLSRRRFSGADEKMLSQLSYRTYAYGPDTVSYAIHRAYDVHRRGYDGHNVLIAVIDAGFQRADTARVFAHIFQRNGVVDTYNFPDDTTWVYTRHFHGTVVWSRIGGLEDNLLVGTAPQADYCLYVSEDVYREMPVEETWWAEAAERADSVGVDVINTSLGYTVFDRPEYNHTWAQLDGKTAIVSIAAQKATEKGIHVVVSAGNSGTSNWKKISFPADAHDVIAVGAADENGVRASFSSAGNTADGRIKPDVMSWGVHTRCYYSGNYYQLNGTSLSAPVITGFVADMVQAYPAIPPQAMKDAFQKASDRYHRPDSLYGYGFPELDRLMQNLDSVLMNQLQNVVIYPNPFQNHIFIQGNVSSLSYAVFDMTGKLIREGRINESIETGYLDKGIYIYILYDGHRKRYFKLIKQDR